MATKSAAKRNLDAGGFDVVCTIGRVEFGNGSVSPEVAAFKLIAEHGAPGGYSFPTAAGGLCHVEVSFTNPEGEPLTHGWEPGR